MPAPRTVLHFCSKRRYIERILRFCNFVGETDEDLVESSGTAEEINKSWRIAQDNINQLEDHAYSSTSDNESNGDRNIQDHIDDASTSLHASTEKTEDGQHTFPMGLNINIYIFKIEWCASNFLA